MSEDFYDGPDESRPHHPNKYGDKIDQLFSIAKEMEKRLSPVLRQEVDAKEPIQGAGTQQLQELTDLCRQFENILVRIEL